MWKTRARNVCTFFGEERTSHPCIEYHVYVCVADIKLEKGEKYEETKKKISIYLKN
jgi:hypothetical protein